MCWPLVEMHVKVNLKKWYINTKSDIVLNHMAHFVYDHNAQLQPSTLLTVPLGMKNYKIVAYMRDNMASR